MANPTTSMAPNPLINTSLLTMCLTSWEPAARPVSSVRILGPVFRVQRPDGRPVRLKFRPFYDFAEEFPYLMYFDRNASPYALW